MTPGKRWRHVTINARNSWLHGDPRGFRDRDHRIHSSGDYKNPPPPGEHEGLHRYHKQRSGDPVSFEQSLFEIIGTTIISNLAEHGHPLLAIAVCAKHTHLLTELPDSLPQIGKIIGWAKQKSSVAVSKMLPGSVWAAGGDYRPIKNRAHHVEVFHYILERQGAGAWTWSFRSPAWVKGDPGPEDPA